MPFVIQCPFCKLRAQVPDRANGAVGKCPKCANSFTLAPADDQSLPEAVARDADPSSSDLEPVASSAMSAAIAEATAAAKRPAPEEPTSQDDAQTPSRGRMKPATVTAAVSFFLAGLAWAFAPFSALTFLVIPLCVCSFVLAIAALALACFSTPRRFVLPVVAGATSLFVFCVIFVTPSMLGPTFERSRQRSRPHQGMQAIPLGNAPILAQAPEWTDASKYSLQSDAISVRIVSVAVGLPPGTMESKPKPNAPKFLNVRMRVTLPQQKVGHESKAFDWTDKRQPKLTDAAATPIALRETHAYAPAGAKRRADLFPVQTTEEVFVFELPPAGWESLRLEIPAIALGGNGVFRFTIPAAMLEAAPPKENK